MGCIISDHSYSSLDIADEETGWYDGQVFISLFVFKAKSWILYIQTPAIVLSCILGSHLGKRIV